jgi:peptidoglycan hydrolase-like protein with peptidoglycan-binding domain
MPEPDELYALPNEPAPIQPTNAAGTMPDDPDQTDVSQDPTPDLDEAEHAALLATAGGVTAHTILTLAASQIGTGESPPGSNKNKYSKWYGAVGAWCWMFLCWLFDQKAALALIFGKHAYVPYFKAVFSAHGEFHTSNPKTGDLVAFDFNRSGDPEHIGIVEKVVSGSVIQTIEGNTSDHVMRRTRSRSYVYGYATPKYAAAPPADPDAYPGTVYRYVKGKSLMAGSHVKWIQQRLGVHRHAVSVDSQYGPKTAAAVKAFQKDAKLTQDSQVGPKTWAALAK